MRSSRGRFAFAAAVVGIVLMQALGVWELSRSDELSEVRRTRLLLILGATGCLAAALAVTGRSTYRGLAVAVDGDRVRLAMEAAKAVAWDWDVTSGRDTWFGDLSTLFGLSGDTYVGKVEDFRHRVHPDDRELVWRAVAHARDHHTIYRATFRLVWPDGTIRWASASGAFRYSSSGEPVRMMGIAVDISDRKRIEEELRESEERFALMADTVPVPLWMSDQSHECNYVNRAWLEFTGLPLEAALGHGWADGIHPDDLARALTICTQAFDRREPFKMEYRLRRHDGAYRWILDTGAPRFDAANAFAGYMGSAIDVTTLKLAEKALTALSHRLIEAHETERTSIARALDDDVGQRMALLVIDLYLWEQSVARGTGNVAVQALRNRATELGEDLHLISRGLRSATLELLGVESAAASFCKELSEQQRVTIDFTHSGIPQDLSPDIALCLFRVLQEALRNAVKHAGVQRFTVSLSGGWSEVQLEVVDDGLGFDPEAAMERHGLGLIGMRERLHLVKGRLSIESRPGGGTKIRAHVPLRAASAN